jgi:hypothetical protein
VRFLVSAFRHGVSEADIRHVLANQWRVELDDDGMEIVIGLDTRNHWLEIGVLTDSDTGESIVVHAMRARPKFLR